MITNVLLCFYETVHIGLCMHMKFDIIHVAGYRYY